MASYIFAAIYFSQIYLSGENRDNKSLGGK